MKSRIELVRELHGRSLNEVNEMRVKGLISKREWEGFVFVWRWLEPRALGSHGRFEKQFGVEAYWRRINRVRAIFDLIPYIKLSSWDEASDF